MRTTSSFTHLALSFAIAFASLSGSAYAQDNTQHSMAGMSMPSDASPASASSEDMSESSQAFRAADRHMMQQMASPYSGSTDRDFVEHMMPHHEGAVAMAKIELQYGKDPALKRMARDIIKSQDEEIVFMKKWLKAHPAK